MVRKLWSFPAFFVDPSNSGGNASDSNGGLTSNTPILTTNEFNKRIFNRQITVDATITYLSDDIAGAQIDLTTVALATTGSLNFKGTPQILHTGGVFNVGTNAINPATQQRQTAHTTDLGSFAPFVFTGLGGGAAIPCLIVDTTNPNLDNSAWIVSGIATANCSRPVSPSLATGGFTVGDGYVIQRGSKISFVALPTGIPFGNGNFSTVPSSNSIQFSDFTITADSGAPTSGAYIRCAFLTPIVSSATYLNCFFTNDIIIVAEGLTTLAAGVLVTTGNGSNVGRMNLCSDLYITGTGLIISASSMTNVYITPSVGAFILGSGIQVQDTTSASGAIIVNSPANLGAGIQGNPIIDPTQALLWGNGNTGPGIRIDPGVTTQVAAGASVRPTVTGTGGDFVFTGQNGGGAISVARAVLNGAYTEAGGAATRATTWSNFATAIGIGGFGFQAHDPDTNAAIIGV